MLGVRRLPSPSVSPPYWVSLSSLPSSCRWSCLRRRPAPVRVITQVRERSSPTWNGIRISSAEQSRTCMTRDLPAKAASASTGGLAIRPAKALPHKLDRRAKNRSCADGGDAAVAHPASASTRRRADRFMTATLKRMATARECLLRGPDPDRGSEREERTDREGSWTRDCRLTELRIRPNAGCG